jgi:glucose-6-phosphate isomerase
LLQQLDQLAAQQPLVSTASCTDLAQWRAMATELWSKSTQLVVIGTGGASLGAQALCAMSEYAGRVRFFENCDPATVEHFCRLPVEETAWCIVSKSGETVETLAAALSLIGHYAHAPSLLRERLVVIVGDANSTLAQVAASQGWTILEHPEQLGGRFSVFSVVGLFPAAYAGLDIEAIHAAAANALRADETILAHAAWLAATMREKPIHVIMAYADRLRAATQWYKQLWAESLGKEGHGSTLVTAIGSIDQHSQLQLYLDGPRDKLVTLWLPDVADQGAPLPSLGIAGLEYLSGHRMGEVMQATAEATAMTLANAGVPLRVARGRLDAPSLAAWMARQMMETLAVAVLLGVDPYSQPAVEEGKKLTRAALARRDQAGAA